jgi:hypothetical protein
MPPKPQHRDAFELFQSHFDQLLNPAHELVQLARTILSKRLPEAEPLVELEDGAAHDAHEVEHRLGYDPVAEGLGLTPDEDVVRLDDSQPAG